MLVVEESEFGGGQPVEGVADREACVERAAPAAREDDEEDDELEDDKLEDDKLEDDILEDDILEDDEEDADFFHLSFSQIGRVCNLAFTSCGIQPSVSAGKHTGQSLRSTVSSSMPSRLLASKSVLLQVQTFHKILEENRVLLDVIAPDAIRAAKRLDSCTLVACVHF